jgi:hypothetical protein
MYGTIKMKVTGNLNCNGSKSAQLDVEIVKIERVDELEWLCEILINQPIFKNVTIFGVDRSNVISNTALFVANLIAPE